MIPTKQTRATEEPSELAMAAALAMDKKGMLPYEDTCAVAKVIDRATGLPALLAERDQLREACNSALIALEHPESATWRQTALTDLRAIANQETKA